MPATPITASTHDHILLRRGQWHYIVARTHDRLWQGMNLGVDDNRSFAFGAFIGIFHILSIPYSAQIVKFGGK